MAASSPLPSRRPAAKTVPVRVTIDRQVKKPTLPPLPPEALAPTSKTSVVVPRPAAKKTAERRTPVHAWPLEKRQRLMWLLVGGGAFVMVIGWLAVIRLELAAGSSGPDIITDVVKVIKSIRWPGQTPATPAEQEIRRLDQQIFPQFQTPR